MSPESANPMAEDSVQYRIFDIETILEDWFVPQCDPDLVLSQVDFTPPATHRLASISWMDVRGDYTVSDIQVMNCLGEREVSVLNAFMTLLQDRSILVTWNGRRFDVPLLVYRCYAHKIQIPEYYRNYHNNFDTHLDLMEFFSDRGRVKFSKMDHLAKLAGLPGKMDMVGADVAFSVAEGKIKEVMVYNVTDVLQTYVIFLRARLLGGRFSSEYYDSLVERFRDQLASDAFPSPNVKRAGHQLLQHWELR